MRVVETSIHFVFTQPLDVQHKVPLCLVVSLVDLSTWDFLSGPAQKSDRNVVVLHAKLLSLS